MSKLSSTQKDKIVHLWKYKRTQRKNRQSRYLGKRLSFIVFFLLLNGFLIWTTFKLSSPDPLNALPINYFENFQIARRPFWLFKTLHSHFVQKLAEQNPLAEEIQIKPVIWPGKPRLKIKVQNYIPWARFMHGWILAFQPKSKKLKIISKTINLNFQKVAFASPTLIICPKSKHSYHLADKYAVALQNLIYTLNIGLPIKTLFFHLF